MVAMRPEMPAIAYSDAAFRQENEQRHLAARVGQPGGGRDEADLAAHRLQHAEHRIGGHGAGVLLHGVLHGQRPVARELP
jgi:hypothetical protein